MSAGIFIGTVLGYYSLSLSVNCLFSKRRCLTLSRINDTGKEKLTQNLGKYAKRGLN